MKPSSIGAAGWRVPNIAAQWGSIMNMKSVIISSLGLLVAGDAFATTTQITDYNQGWYNKNDPTQESVGSTANYIVGKQVIGTKSHYDDFFSFDLAGIASGSITAASVEISGGQNVFTSGPNGVFELYASDVDPATDRSGFLKSLKPDDLIGTVSVTDGGTLSSSDPTLSDVIVTLNATGLADLNAAAGGDFYIGGTFTGAKAYNLAGLKFENLFNGSGNVAGAELSLTSVPEPSTWAMLLAGFMALGAAGYAGRRQRASIVD